MSDKTSSVSHPTHGVDSSDVDVLSIKGRVTINDIARLANVSKKTVSRVINDSPLVREETRQKVKAVIEAYGFRPDPQARALAFRRSFLIGMIYDNPNPQYVVNIQRGILDVLESTDHQLVLQPTNRSAEDYYDRIRRFIENHRPTGLILTPSISEDEDLAAMLRELECNYVRVASVDLDEPGKLVRTDDAAGAAEAARHLARLGHTKIAHISGPRSFRSVHQRLFGFREGLSEFGLELDPALLIEGGYNFETGMNAAEDLLTRRDRPTAIFAGNDEMAIGVYTAARKVGLNIPDDVSVVGFDDTPMASRIWPSLTTVRLQIRDMGREAANTLLHAVSEGDMPRRSERFTPEILLRESSAPPST
ncbi:MAG: LacI family DNA-binding transcriptional regulator [Pseudomonadota bacterium]